MKHIMPSNKLLSCCNPILNHLSPFFDGARVKNVVPKYRDIFLADFIELERNAAAMQIDYAQVQQVKYVMAALVDEIILHSSWDGSVEWLGQPLQLYFFSEHLAGEEFFTRLNRLRQDTLSHCDLLEVYYVCLQLGFSGIYRIKGQEFLQGLQVGLYQQILAARSQQNNNVSPSQLVTNRGTKKNYRELSIWIISVITLLMILIIYFSFLWVIDRKADWAVHQIDHDLVIPIQNDL